MQLGRVHQWHEYAAVATDKRIEKSNWVLSQGLPVGVWLVGLHGEMLLFVCGGVCGRFWFRVEREGWGNQPIQRTFR